MIGKKTEKAGATLTVLPAFLCAICAKFLISNGCVAYAQPGMIASLGQTSAQEPHSMQVSGSM